MMFMRTALSLLILLFLTNISYAHTRSQSFSTWLVQEQSVHLTLSILSREVTRLAADESVNVTLPLEQIYINHISSRLNIEQDGQPCLANAEYTILPAKDGYIRLENRFHCPSHDQFNIQFDAMFDVVPSHLHYAHIKRQQGSSYELVLSDANRDQSVWFQQAEQSLWQTAGNYLLLGIEHILIGIDHLVFLLALLLLCRTLKQVIILITGFTLGHSLTLSLSVLGWLQPATVTVEALIGFSIALVVLEILQKQQARLYIWPMVIGLSALLVVKWLFAIGLPALSLIGIMIFACAYLMLSHGNHNSGIQFLLTLAFGFIHGFGFAEVLREIGLPTGQLAMALFSFNVGVEIGQLIALAVATPFIYYLANSAKPTLKTTSYHYGLAFILFMGSYWFISRSLTF